MYRNSYLYYFCPLKYEKSTLKSRIIYSKIAEMFSKVKLFWEGHKNLHNIPHGFEIYLVNFTALMGRSALNQQNYKIHLSFCSNWNI